MTDPVLAKRARIRSAVSVAKRTGYALFAVAVVVFFVALALGPTPLLVAVVVGSLAVGSVLLAPAIVFGYAVAAADREDREAGRVTGGETER